MRTVLGLAALLLSQVIAWPIVLELGDADRCADAGGSFDYEAGRCDFGARHPGAAIWERYGMELVLGGALGVTGAVVLLRRRKG